MVKETLYRGEYNPEVEIAIRKDSEELCSICPQVGTIYYHNLGLAIRVVRRNQNTANQLEVIAAGDQAAITKLSIQLAELAVKTSK
jgi:hypothetical protein